MSKSVLSLGEMMVLAARLGTAEHVRQELNARAVADAREQAVADRFKDEPAAVKLSRPVPVLLKELFRAIERKTPMPRVREAA